ncbi:hypothetical protein [Vibrio barjaei]|uniref:hypothetical protein n=1 Tax=Vibrio barjaei TaxID=1676683 RepID=UPI00228409EC|nr:hypothetical protein [Vibrio barjaei]MCY9873005.1 hypothetical protein [Vibrio barjaei]
MLSINEFKKYHQLVQEINLDLPNGVTLNEMDFKHDLHWHEWHIKDNVEHGSFSLFFGGNTHDQDHTVFRGELRFLTSNPFRGRYSCTLFCTYGQIYAFKHYNLDHIDKKEERFIYAESKEELIKKATTTANKLVNKMAELDTGCYAK